MTEPIRHYREFSVSPQGEWIDLEIHSQRLDTDNDRPWDSGFDVAARIEREKKICYAAMKIPIGSIDGRPARAGNRMRINFYRLQGPLPEQKGVVWQSTGRRSHHVPESFGELTLWGSEWRCESHTWACADRWGAV